jgi:predicted ATPase/DNA-binding SARP family transcriptional activator
MTGLSLALFGVVTVTCNEERLERFRTSRVQALLLYLATEQIMGTTTHRREALMELLWPGLPLQSAQVNLRQTIYHLRRAIPEIVDEASGDDLKVRINPLYPIDSDLARFIQLLEGSIEQRIDATEIYRGDFLADFYLVDSAAYESWIAKRRAAFRRQALDVLTDLATYHTEAGTYSEAEGFARRQLEIDNLSESAYRQLMMVLTLSGRRSEAISVYDECRQLLQSELGIEPSAETLDLLEKIRTQKLITGLSKRLPADYAVPITIEEVGDDLEGEDKSPLPAKLMLQELERRPRHNLPPQPGRFIGREVELADLDAFIADPKVHLITIFGAGGIGKTRLALATGERQYQRALAKSPKNGDETLLSPPSPIINGDAKQEPTFVDGVFFVSLASLSSADQIVPTVAKAIDFRVETEARQSRSQKRQLLDYLNKKRLLLVMDNFEHLSDGAELLSEVVINAPDVQLLVTSRERLHLHHEQVYPIHGLGFLLGDTGIPIEASDVLESPAAKLFLQSARRIQPDFEPSVGDIENLMSICSLVEGMPLALELAASWAEVLSMQEIAVEIRRSLDFLETTERDVPRRQRSMRALFESAWGRLSESERQVFARLSVFRGGFTRQAAKTITGASIRLLAALVDKSFLHYDSQRGRYQIHELLRQFGAEKLAQKPSELNQVRDQHCTYFCEWLRNKEPKLTGVGQQTVLTEIEVDGENARLAWYRAVSNKDLTKLYRTMDSLALFYKMTGRYQQAEQATDKAAEALRTIMMDSVETDLFFKSSVESPVPVPRLLSRVLTWRAFFLSFFGRSIDADRSLRESLALLDRPELTGHDVASFCARGPVVLGPKRSATGGTAVARESVNMSRGG